MLSQARHVVPKREGAEKFIALSHRMKCSARRNRLYCSLQVQVSNISKVASGSCLISLIATWKCPA